MPPGLNRPDEEAAIASTWSRFSRAWQRGDVGEAAAAFDSDGDHRLLTPSGRVLKGRDELTHAFSQAFAQRHGAGGRSLRCTLASVRFLQPDVAIVDGTLAFGPGIDPPGRPLPPCEEPFTAVMHRQDQVWFIAACRAGALQTQTQ